MPKTRGRLMFLSFAITMLVFSMWGRIAYIKLVKGDEYEKAAAMQQSTKKDKTIMPLRGSILDRNRQDLVITKRVYNIGLSPSQLAQKPQKSQEKTIDALSQYLGIDKASLQNALKEKATYKLLKKKVDKDTTDKLKALKLDDVSYDEDYTRNYLYNSLAAHLLGFASGGAGRWGLEKQYDDTLTGIPGRMFMTFKEQSASAFEQVPAENGKSLVLTLDKNIQNIIENTMQGIIQRDNPKNASIIVMNPSTGEVLGMVSYPNFDLNNPSNFQDKLELEAIKRLPENRTEGDILNTIWRNYSISDAYEPGSTFKAVVMASALEEGVVTENDRFYCAGFTKLYDRTIECANRKAHGDESLEDVLKNSCNLGMMQIAEKMQKDLFYRYQKIFGFGEKTGIDLPGEQDESALLRTAKQLGPVELANSAFGQGFNVTPIQMLNAFCSVVNGGNLMKPYVVSQIIDENGSVVQNNEPVIVRKVISESVSNTMKQYLETVVRDGTGNKAYIPGYRIGGKTATSQKIQESNKFNTRLYVGSFIGVAPADNPKVAVLALIDEPKNGQHMGGQIAAPVVKEVLENVLKYLEIPKSEELAKEYEEQKASMQDIELPDYTNRQLIEATDDLTGLKLNYKVVGNGDKIINQMPKPGTKVPVDTEILLYVNGQQENVTPQNEVIVPNIVGKNYNEAMQILKTTNLVGTSQEQSGIVIEQQPQKDTKASYGSTVYMKLQK